MRQMSRDLIRDGLGPGTGRCTVPRMQNDFESRPRDGLGHETQHTSSKPLNHLMVGRSNEKRTSVTDAGTRSFTGQTTKVMKSVTA